MIQLPGLIDPHTHLRVPGGEHKETFETGTAAALAGGITMVLGMPNTNPPLATAEVLDETLQRAENEILCDVGLFAGASGRHLNELPTLAKKAVGLKVYLNDTYGTLRIDEIDVLAECFKRWPEGRVIALHAEKQSVAVSIAMAALYDRPIHIVHVSRKQEIELIADAKMKGLPVTCEVAPHHLYMTHADRERLGPFGDMRPELGTPMDVEALWAHINDTVDCIATDHAPHTVAEKESDSPPPGIIGLETSLPLMWRGVVDGKLSQTRLIELMHTNPKKIFGLPDQPDTYVEFDGDADYIFTNDMVKSKVGWSPFNGREMIGKVVKVVLRGKTVFEQGQVVAQPGDGRLI